MRDPDPMTEKKGRDQILKLQFMLGCCKRNQSKNVISRLLSNIFTLLWV